MERGTNDNDTGGDGDEEGDDNEVKQKNKAQEMLASLGPQVSFFSFVSYFPFD